MPPKWSPDELMAKGLPAPRKPSSSTPPPGSSGAGEKVKLIAEQKAADAEEAALRQDIEGLKAQIAKAEADEREALFDKSCAEKYTAQHEKHGVQLLSQAVEYAVHLAAFEETKEDQQK